MKKLSLGMIAALALAVFAFGAALHVNRTVFERLPHLEDEYAYLFQARVFAGGHLWVERPADVEVKVLWQPFVIQPDQSNDGVLKRFGKYTPGWPLALALGVLLDAPWIVNAFMAALVVVLIYRMGREIFDEAVGVVAALLMAISPMALLLNATLMSHTSALFFTMLFVYAYWRTTRLDRGWRALIGWGLLAGFAIGWVAMTRPLTAVAMAAPVALHALSRLFEAFESVERKNSAVLPITLPPMFKAIGERLQGRTLPRVLVPLIALGVVAAPLAATIFVFNHAVTGDWRSELYTMQWSYDQIGFGDNHGLMPGGHTLEYGWRNARSDLGIWARDLFGWTLDPGLADYAANNWGWGAGIGISWIVLVVGLIVGRKNEWVWLLFELFIAIVLAQLLYWIGSTVYGSAVYSTRYYYEAMGGIVLISALGLVTLARKWRSVPMLANWIMLDIVAIVAVIWLTLRTTTLQPEIGARLVTYLLIALAVMAIGWVIKSLTSRPVPFFERLSVAWNVLWPGYIIVIVMAGASLIGYTPARLAEPLPSWPNGLYGYNEVGQYQIDALNKMRDPGKPVLVIVLNSPKAGVEDNWRDYGALMAVTSPYLNSDIVVARVFDVSEVDKFVQRFPGRQVLYEIGKNLYHTSQEALASEGGAPSSGTS